MASSKYGKRQLVMILYSELIKCILFYLTPVWMKEIAKENLISVYKNT